MTYPLATLASFEYHRGCVDIAVHRSEVQKVYEQQPLDISQPISCSNSNTASLCLSLPFFLHVSFRICYRSINSFFPVFSFRPCFLLCFFVAESSWDPRITIPATNTIVAGKRERAFLDIVIYIYICSLSSIGKWDRTRWLDFCGHPVLDMSLTDNDRLPCILFCS